MAESRKVKRLVWILSLTLGPVVYCILLFIPHGMPNFETIKKNIIELVFTIIIYWASGFVLVWALYWLGKLVIKYNYLKEYHMELLKFKIPMSKLCSISEREKAFFIQICNFLNDLSILQKLTLFSTSKKETNEIVRIAQNIQALFLLRIQAGKLHEGWQILQKNFFKEVFSAKYIEKLTSSEKESYDKVRAYFDDNRNLISWTRNNFAFHYFTKCETIEQLFDKVSDSEKFEIYLSEFYGNCVFSMSNTLVTFAILKYTGLNDKDKAMEKLLLEVTGITKSFGHFLGRFILVFAEEHLELESEKVEIPEPPYINEVAIPYFIKGDRN